MGVRHLGLHAYQPHYDGITMRHALDAKTTTIRLAQPWRASCVSRRRPPWRPVWQMSVWCLLLWCFVSPAGASKTPGFEAPCARWNDLLQQRLSPAHIPRELTRLLAHYQGNGLFATFVEEKNVALLRRPLHSTGELVFFPGKGLYRRLRTPFVQEMLITPEAIYQWDQSDDVERFALEQLPHAKAFVEALLAVFSGSWEVLHRHFQVYFSIDNQRWKLGLRPNYPVMQRLIACLILEGKHEQVTALWVQETSGDVTHDRFSDSRLLTPEQWTEYQHYFESPQRRDHRRR